MSLPLTLLSILAPSLIAAYWLHRFVLKQKLAVANEKISQLEKLCEEKNLKLEQYENLKESQSAKISDLSSTLEALKAEKRVSEASAQEKVAFLQKTHAELEQRFSELSAQALKSNQSDFLQLAKSTFEQVQKNAQGKLEERQKSIEGVIKPIAESLEKFDHKLQSLDKNRSQEQASLSEQIQNLLKAHHQLQGETTKLSQALRAPNVRGQWGEMQLRRTVELAGMLAHVDFNEQNSFESEDGRLRPDMVVNLPNGNHIIVDAKAPLQAYLEASEASSPQVQKERLGAHAKHLKNHLNQLASKAYWKQLEGTPEFVVLFLPGETFFSAALQEDPTLIDHGASHRVILATPTTLIALLKAVAYGWKQESIAKEAKAISELGATLYERVHTMAGHFSDLKKHLERSVGAYNKTLRSMETRVLPTARKFQGLQSSTTKELPEAQEIDIHPSTPSSEELSTPSLTAQ